MMSLQEFSVEIFEWSGSSWVPYVAKDVQVQFYMMSPYVLKTLSTNQKVLYKTVKPFLITTGQNCHFISVHLLQGLYHTSFKVPDVYGVFQFKVEYQSLGYTTLSLSKQVSHHILLFYLHHLFVVIRICLGDIHRLLNIVFLC